MFSPEGTQLIVTTKASGNDVDVFGVAPGGALSATPVVNSLPGTVLFAVTFNDQGNLVLAESAGALASFKLQENGVINQLDVVPSEQIATCWVVQAHDHFHTSNPGSASLSEFTSTHSGQLLTLVGDTKTDGGHASQVAAPDRAP